MPLQLSTMSFVLEHLRSGLRLWRRNPAFTAIAVTALALGIGANTAIFSVVNAILLRPLPYADSDRIGILWEESREQGWSRINPSGPNYLDFKEQSHSIEEMALMEVGTGTVTGFGEPQQFPGLRVTTNFISFFGVKPVLGRDFQPKEGWQDRVVILSYSAWQKWFGGTRDVIGRKVIADGLAYTVIGVTPANFWLPVPADAFVPWGEADLRNRNRMDHSLPVLVRLKPGVSWKEASAEVATIESRLAALEPRMKGWTANVFPLRDSLVDKVRPALLVLLGAVGLVLLIACTNLANLLLARASARRRETAIRAALGASRGHLVRLFLSESMLLGLAGGILGLVLAYWGVDLLNALIPTTLRVSDTNAQVLRPHIGIDTSVLIFTLFASLFTGFLFGIVPALTASRSDFQDALKDGTRNSASGGRRHTQNALVIGEVALALILMVTATLTIKSFWNLQQVNPGFQSARTLVVETELPTDSKYRSDQEQRDFFRRVLANVNAIPGIQSAGITCALPMDETQHEVTFNIEGRPLPPSGQLLPAAYRAVSPGFFAAMGIPLRHGRVFTDMDNTDHPPVVVIDEALASRYWPRGVAGAQDPVGQRLRIGRTVMEIVGVVGSVRSGGLDKMPELTVYTSFDQDPEPHVSLVIRHPQAENLLNAVKRAFYSVDKDQPVFKARTLQEVVDGTQNSSRFTLGLLATFAGVALLLASLGIYGVISYAVAQRQVEIGIRMALGADRPAVLRMVVGDGLTLALWGVGLGLLGSLALARALGTTLFGVSGHDPVILSASAAALALVGALASYVPARRAVRIDPLTSLRSE